MSAKFVLETFWLDKSLDCCILRLVDFIVQLYHVPPPPQRLVHSNRRTTTTTLITFLLRCLFLSSLLNSKMKINRKFIYSARAPLWPSYLLYTKTNDALKHNYLFKQMWAYRTQNSKVTHKMNNKYSQAVVFSICVAFFAALKTI